MPSHSRLPVLAGALLLCLAACSSPQPEGSVQLSAVQQSLSASDVTRVKVTVSASDMTSLSVDLAKSNGSWGGLIGNIPAGSNRSFLAEAFDSSGTKRFQGQTSGVTITANQTAAVVLPLQELAPPAPYGNEAPLIDSVVASTTSVQTGGTLTLTATAHDPNTGDTLTYAWTGTGGTFSAPTAASTSWTAPASTGAQTLTFTVTDSQGAAVSVSLAVNVVSGASTGNASLNVTFNLYPVVSKVSASLNRLDAGQSTAVSATASDADGDALSYQWTASCPGTWTGATSSAASFVPSSVPASACNNCRLTVTVQDGHGGQTTGSLNLCIASASTDHFAPSITNFYQSATTASAGQTVTFDVTAMDSQASTLTFAWSANTGSLAAAQNTATTSHMVWTAPSCVLTGVTPTITAVVTNAYGLSASKAFSVSGLPACPTGWSPAGSLSASRQWATATRLSSGKVLVAGGLNFTTTIVALASAELYDPATNSWSPAGSMAADRMAHTATLLQSGKVLVAGGADTNFADRPSAELYDPATNTWSPAGSMAVARDGHTAILLPTSGKVLIVGGGSASAELYNPATNTWSSAGSMATSRATPTATLLSTGKVLVAGGGPATAELYDPATNTWSSAGSMAAARDVHTATLLSTGKVLVAGGYASGVNLASAELYDPATNTWSSAGSMTMARRMHTATLLSTGKVLVTGSFNGSVASTSAELYDPATNTWSATGSMSSPRHTHTATLLTSGKVLVAGGDRVLPAELYDPTAN